MKAYQRYGIRAGQVYARADGSAGPLVVKDVETYADVDDVVVFDELENKEYRIDAFKLAQVRYKLSADCTAAEVLSLVNSLRTDEASTADKKKSLRLALGPF